MDFFILMASFPKFNIKNQNTQGIVEGINNKFKLIKRKAYGFKNFDNFRLRSLSYF